LTNEQDPEDLYYSYRVLSKARLEDEDQLLEGLLMVLLNGIVARIKIGTKHILERTTEAALKNLKKITLGTYTHMVVKNSIKEGSDTYELLSRAAMVLQQRAFGDQLLEFPYKELQTLESEFIKIATGLRQLQSREAKNEEEALDELELEYDPKYPIQYVAWEHFTEGRIVNGLHKALGLGDIFKSGTGSSCKYWVLLGQECDIAVRRNGKRRNNLGYLVLLKKDVKDADKDLIYPSKWHPEMTDKLSGDQYKEFGAAYALNTHMIISMDVLDMCVYRRDGKALNVEYVSNYSLIHSSLDNHKQSQKTLLDHIENLLSEIPKNPKEPGEKSTAEAKKDIIRRLTLIKEAPGLENHIKITLESSKLMLNLERIGRLAPKHASDVYGAFIRYLGRTAHDLPFMRED
jgi:hypothetical protein